MSFLIDGLRVSVNEINGLGKGSICAPLVSMSRAIHPMLDAKHQARARPALVLPKANLRFDGGRVPHPPLGLAQRLVLCGTRSERILVDGNLTNADIQPARAGGKAGFMLS